MESEDSDYEIVGLISGSSDEQDQRHLEAADAMLIVGSSRMMRLNPALVAERTGLRPFNAAIPGAYPIDFYVMYRFATEELHAPLRQLLVGVDPLIFFGGEGSYHKIENNAELRRFLPAQGGLSSDIGQLSLLVSPAQSKDGLKSLLHALRPARHENAMWRVFEADGWQSRNYQDAKREAGKWDQPAIIEKQLKGWYMNPKKAPTLTMPRLPRCRWAAARRKFPGSGTESSSRK